MPVLIAVAIIIAVVLIIGWFQDRAIQARTQQLQARAQKLGFRFSEKAEPQLLHGVGRFLLFLQGRSGEIANVMQGERTTPAGQVEVALFEYAFTLPVGRYTRSWLQTVVRLSSEELSLPAFNIIPELIFDQMVERTSDQETRERLLGTADLRFREHPTFSKWFHVQGPDRSRVRALFTEQLIDFYNQHKVLCTEGSQQELLFYRFDERLDPEEIEAFLDTTLQAFALYRAAEP